jgi:hypothetical protein
MTLGSRGSLIGLLSLISLGLLGAPCGQQPLPPLPALVASSPASGSVVSGAAWVHLTFAGTVPGARRIDLHCNGQSVAATKTLLTPEQVVVNPAADLSAGASCEARWMGSSGLTTLPFTIATPGVPATLFYDRTDPRALGPMPDDYYTAAAATPTGLELVITPPVIPGAFEQALSNGLVNAANGVDGWSPVGFAVFELSDALHPASIPSTPAESLDPLASIGWFDLTPGSPTLGERIPFRSDLRSELHADTGIVHHTLILFPSVRLEPGGRSAVVVTRRAQVSAARPLDPSAAFAAVLAPPQAGEGAEIPVARALTDTVLAELAGHAALPFDRQDVAVALLATTRSATGFGDDMLAMRSAILALPAPQLTITSVDLSIQHGVHAELRGTWNAPDFRDPSSGLLARDVAGAPIQTGTNDVPFVLALPFASLTAPAPLIFYQHGNPGSADEVPWAVSRTGSTGDSLASRGFAGIGFTDPPNREIGQDTGLQAQVTLLTLMSRSAVPDSDVQAWAEQVAFVKLIEALGTLDVLPLVGGAPGGDGVPDLDVSVPLYFGLSQGAVKGSGSLAYLPEIRAAALVVGGARSGELLVHQAQFTGLLAQLQGTLPNLTPSELWAGLVAYQIASDAQDPHNHAPFLYQAPHPLGTPSRASLLITEGLFDSLIPNHSTRALAWTFGGVPHVGPVQQTTSVLNEVTAPVTANIDTATTAAYFQFVPMNGLGLTPTPGCQFQPEGHYCPQTAPEALDQRITFFESALSGPAPIVIDPL